MPKNGLCKGWAFISDTLMNPLCINSLNRYTQDDDTHQIQSQENSVG